MKFPTEFSIIALALISFALPAVAPAAQLAQTYERAGPHAVLEFRADWRDPVRERMVPVKQYIPQGDGPFPVILFSHGLGGSREGGAGWGAHWATHGFLVIHLQHPGSDESLWRGRRIGEIRSALVAGMTAQQFLERNADVAFVLDDLARRRAGGDPLLRGADLARVGMSGHSFGARTTLAVAGERIALIGSNPDPRISAAVAFSPAATGPDTDFAGRFAPIAIPVLSITGTDDDDVVNNGSTPENRRLPFLHMRPPGKYLLVLRGANHMVFNGVPGAARLAPTAEATIFRHARAVSTAFWKAWLQNDAGARAWLAEDGFARRLGTDDEFLLK